MNAIKKLWWVFALSVVGACYWPDGMCWAPDDPPGGVGTGAGGGPIIPGGTGGFGEAPNEPLADDGYVPCTQTAQCVVTWAADSDVCKSKGEGTCTTIYQGEHSTLEEAKTHCEFVNGAGKGKSGALFCESCQWVPKVDENEKCKRLCDKIYNKCMDNCKDGPCRDACFADYTECLRECDR